MRDVGTTEGSPREIPIPQVGLAIPGPLRDLDEIAYLRFASVYRRFTDREDFQTEIALLRAESAPAPSSTSSHERAPPPMPTLTNLDPRPCQRCREPFTPPTGSTRPPRFCSDACRRTADALRKREERAALRERLDAEERAASRTFLEEVERLRRRRDALERLRWDAFFRDLEEALERLMMDDPDDTGSVELGFASPASLLEDGHSWAAAAAAIAVPATDLLAEDPDREARRYAVPNVTDWRDLVDPRDLHPAVLGSWEEPASA